MDLFSFFIPVLLHQFPHRINLSSIQTLPDFFVLEFCTMGLGRAEQHSKLCVRISRGLYPTVQQPVTILAPAWPK